MNKYLKYIIIFILTGYYTCITSTVAYAAFPVLSSAKWGNNVTSSNTENVSAFGDGGRHGYKKIRKHYGYKPREYRQRNYYYEDSDPTFASLLSLFFALLAPATVIYGVTKSAGILASRFSTILIFLVLPISFAWAAIHFGTMGIRRISRPRVFAVYGKMIGILIETLYCILFLTIFAVLFAVVNISSVPFANIVFSLFGSM